MEIYIKIFNFVKEYNKLIISNGIESKIIIYITIKHVSQYKEK